MNKPDYVDEIVGSDVPHVEPGTYLAKLEGVERATTKFGGALRWHWTVPSEGDFLLVQLTSEATTGGSNAGKVIRALLGRTLVAGERLPATQLAGKRASLEVEVNPESGWNRVREVYPAPKVAARPVSTEPVLDELGF